MKLRTIVLCIVALVVTMGACSEASPLPTATPESPLNNAMESPLTAPEPLAVDVSETTGAVRGALIGRTEDGEYKPVADYIIGLAELVPRDDGQGALAAAYDPNSAPVTKTDEQGRFVINNIEPGDYGLILDAVMNQALLSYPDKNGSILITIKPGEYVDLGTLRYDSLPIFGFAN